MRGQFYDTGRTKATGRGRALPGVFRYARLGNAYLLAPLLACGLALTSLCSPAQTLLDTITVGSLPTAVAINSNTNKIYVANRNSNNVTVIDGATNSTTTVAVGLGPLAVALDQKLNKAYVANQGSDNVTVIDGSGNATNTVGVGNGPRAIAVNSLTSMIYVANYYDNNVTVINPSSYTTTTVAVGSYPTALAINSATNKIYVANSVSASVTVIDGATNTTSTVVVDSYPEALAINQQTNKIYVANYRGNSVTIIDGATRSAITVDAGMGPSAVAVDSVTNQAYVLNQLDGTATLIDGTTLSATTIAVGSYPNAVQIDTITNKVYLTNFLWAGTLTMVDGTNDSTTTLRVGSFPEALALNWTTNRIYVLNAGDNTVSVIAEASGGALQFVPVTPCRVSDTRWHNGPLGGPPISGGSYRTLPIPSSSCGIPATAAAYSFNVTIVPHGILGALVIWPTGEDRSAISSMNSWDGRIKASAAIVPAGSGGAINVYASGTTDVVLDINGYFVLAPDPSALAFYPLKPCRVSDTRWPKGALGGPYLKGGAEARELPVLKATSCNIPSTAKAYALNYTVVPKVSPLWVVSTWPTGQPQLGTSTLNAPTGTVTANAAIVPAGNNGDIEVWASGDTDLVIDINGYFAPPGRGGLSLYPSAPCRALDTRKTVGRFTGLLIANIAGSPCGIPGGAQAYVLNATVVPNGALLLLALWPDGQSQPNSSTLNAWDGVVTSNMAIVPSTNGSIDAYAAGWTDLVLDISSYFAP